MKNVSVCHIFTHTQQRKHNDRMMIKMTTTKNKDHDDDDDVSVVILTFIWKHYVKGYY